MCDCVSGEVTGFVACSVDDLCAMTSGQVTCLVMTLDRSKLHLFGCFLGGFLGWIIA